MHILFDLDNTLLDFNLGQERALNRLIESLNLPTGPDYQSIYQEMNHKAWSLLEARKITMKALKIQRFEHFLEAIQLDANPQELAHQYESNLSQEAILIQGAITVLEQLSQDNNIHIASNGISYIQRPRIEQSGIGNFVEGIFLSEEIGWAKPQAEYFHYIFEELDNFSPRDYLMIGDSLKSDILGGNNVGIQTIWYNPHGQEQPEDIIPFRSIESLNNLPQLIEAIKK